MSQPDRIEFITELVTPLAASLGLAVWGVELGGAAAHCPDYVDVLPGAEPALPKGLQDDLLPQGVTIDQCAELSRSRVSPSTWKTLPPPTGRSKFPLRGSSALLQIDQ